MKTILVVDTDQDLRQLLCDFLRNEGFNTIAVPDAENAITAIHDTRPSAILVDLVLPGMQGTDFCRVLKSDEWTRRIPVLILSAKTGEFEKILGFELGADDYITKPFSLKELAARLKAVLRRVTEPHDTEMPTVLESGGLMMNFDSHEVRVRGNRIPLRPVEFRLLRFLFTHPDRVFSRSQLIHSVWRGNRGVKPRTVDIHIQRLRAAIEETPSDPRMILTVRGFGYKYRPLRVSSIPGD